MLSGERIDLNLFRVFDAIHRTGSVTQAAAQLHLTQPAISNALRRLREQFDDPLFVRDGRRVAPTPRAKAMAAEVADALRALQQTLKSPQGFPADTSTRRFVLGMRDVLEPVLMPSLMRRVLQDAPHLQVQSTGIERSRLERELLSGAVDLAIDVPFPIGEEIAQERLLVDDLCVVMRSDHPLASGPLRLKSWLAARHIVVSTRRAGAAIEDLALQREGFRRDVAMRCQHYHAACELAATSDLLLVLPKFFAARFSESLPLHRAPVPLAVPRLEIMLYWPHSAESDPGHAWLREHIRDVHP